MQPELTSRTVTTTVLLLALTLTLTSAPLLGQVSTSSAGEPDLPNIRLHLVSDKKQVDQTTQKELLTWLQRFQNAVYRMRIREFLTMVDVPRLATHFSGTDLPEADAPKLLSFVLERQFPAMKDFFSFRDAEIRQIEYTSDNAVIIARVNDADGEEYKLRWWLRRGKEGWRMTDFENLTVNMRLSVVMMAGVQAAKSVSGNSVPLVRAFQQLAQAEQEGDFEGVLSAVASLEKFEIPPQLLELVVMTKIRALQATGETENIGLELDRLEAVAPDQPLLSFWRAAMHIDSYEYAQAIPWLEKYASFAGHDEDSWALLVDAHDNLDQRKKACAVASDWLDDYPQSSFAAWTCWTCLPEHERGSLLRPRLETLSTRHESLDEFADYARSEEDWVAVRLAVEIMKARKFDAALISDWQASLKEATEPATNHPQKGSPTPSKLPPLPQ